jgi:PAS domain S-box-containing protein
MNIQIDFIKAVFSASLWSSLFLAYLLYRRKKAPGAFYLSVLTLASTIWTGGILLGLSTSDLLIKELSLSIIYMGISVIPIILLAFVLDFTGNRKWLKWSYFSILLIVPIIVTTVGFIPSINHVLWNLRLINSVKNTYLYEFGPWFWPFFGYSYAIVIASLITLFRAKNLFASYFKNQTLIFFIAALFPIAFNLIHIFTRDLFGYFDFTPIGFAFSVGILFFGIYNLKIFDLLPVARKTVVEIISDAVLVVDEHFRIILNNKAFLDFFKIKQNKLTGLSLDDVNVELSKILKSSYLTGLSNRIELYQNGKTYGVEINYLKKEDSSIIGAVLVIRNITEQKLFEERLEKSNKELQEQLAINEILISDLKAFSRSVAHNLKSPLNGMLGLSELIVYHAEEGSMQEEWAKSMLQTGLKITDIIDSILLFSSISVKDVRIEKVEMLKVIQESLKRERDHIDSKGAKIILPDNLPEVTGYSPWLEEVWVNLISNAIKYGGNPPEIFFGANDCKNGTVKFFIQDNGNGISSEHMEKLFLPFQNFANTAPDSHGLGLSIVKRIVNKLHGDVFVESENVLGKGCRFGFTLPK